MSNWIGTETVSLSLVTFYLLYLSFQHLYHGLFTLHTRSQCKLIAQGSHKLNVCNHIHISRNHYWKLSSAKQIFIFVIVVVVISISLFTPRIAFSKLWASDFKYYTLYSNWTSACLATQHLNYQDLSLFDAMVVARASSNAFPTLNTKIEANLYKDERVYWFMCRNNALRMCYCAHQSTEQSAAAVWIQFISVAKTVMIDIRKCVCCLFSFCFWWMGVRIAKTSWAEQIEIYSI